MPRGTVHCRICNRRIHGNYDKKDGSQTYFLQETTYWTYSDGKMIPTVKHHYFCSREHLIEWITNASDPRPPADLNCWVNERKVKEET